MLWKCCTQYASKFGKLSSGHRTGKGQFSLQSQRRSEVKWSEVTQSCQTLCNPMDCSLPGFSDHGIFQARVLEWIAISFSWGSSRPRDLTQVSRIVGRRFTKGNAKECSNYRTIALISHASKVMLKFSRPGFSNTWTVSFQMFKLDLEKAEEQEIKLWTSTGSSKKQENSRKTSISALLTMPKPLTVWITKIILKENGNTSPLDLPLEKPVCRSGSNS